MDFLRAKAKRRKLSMVTCYDYTLMQGQCGCCVPRAPEWGGVLAFNEFGFGTVVLKPAPWGVVPKGEWTDHEDRLAAEWLQRQGILVSVEVAGQAVQTAARDRPFHPREDVLAGPYWDGVERVDRWLWAHLGAEDTEYSRRHQSHRSLPRFTL
jgi:predicted P-loop ATPase